MAEAPDYKNNTRLIDPAVAREQENARLEAQGLRVLKERLDELITASSVLKAAAFALQERAPNAVALQRLHMAFDGVRHHYGNVLHAHAVHTTAFAKTKP
jgi:hypothetical protein